MNKNKTIGDKCIETFPDKIPIILHYDNIFQNKNEVQLTKLLVPNNIDINHFTIFIRRKIKIPYTETLEVLINNKNNKPVNIVETISSLYNNNKNPNDGCLHIFLRKECTINY